MIDYRDLLQRYMAHVLFEEGSTFTSFIPHEDFSAEERAVLEEMGDNAGRRYREFFARVDAERREENGKSIDTSGPDPG